MGRAVQPQAGGSCEGLGEGRAWQEEGGERLYPEQKTAHHAELWGGAKTQHGQSRGWARAGGREKPQAEAAVVGCWGVEGHRCEKHQEKQQ